MKKVNAVGLLSLCFMATIFVTGGGSPVRLCGREYVRAVISICGEVHAKRQVPMDYRPDRTDPEYHLGFQELEESQNFKVILAQEKANQALQGRRRRSTERRRDVLSLPATCCSIGCRTADIRSLC